MINPFTKQEMLNIPKITTNDEVADDGTITRTTITTKVETISVAQQQAQADRIQSQIDNLTVQLTPLTKNLLKVKLNPVEKIK
jgi:hypothetical protein